VQLSRQAWEKDAVRKGTPFPLTSPRPFRIRSLGEFPNESDAQEFLKKQQAAHEKRMADVALERKKRLADLSEAEQQKEEARLDALQAAESLLAKNLKLLLDAGYAPPPVTRGIRPDRIPPRPASDPTDPERITLCPTSP